VSQSKVCGFAVRQCHREQFTVSSDCCNDEEADPPQRASQHEKPRHTQFSPSANVLGVGESIIGPYPIFDAHGRKSSKDRIVNKDRNGGHGGLPLSVAPILAWVLWRRQKLHGLRMAISPLGTTTRGGRCHHQLDQDDRLGPIDGSAVEGAAIPRIGGGSSTRDRDGEDTTDCLRDSGGAPSRCLDLDRRVSRCGGPKHPDMSAGWLDDEDR